MQFRYRTYTHADDEIDLVNFSKRIIYSPRGKPVTNRWTLAVEGVHLPAAGTQAATSTGIDTITSAYNFNGGDAVLLHDDGSVSDHAMYSRDFRGGTQVREFSHPAAQGLAYAVGRRFRVVIEGDKDISDDPYVNFQESITLIGGTGSERRWVLMANGPPRRQTIRQRTTQRIVQSGSLVGRNGYITPPAPFWPADEHRERARVTKGSPRRLVDDLVDYPVSWTYEFERAIRSNANPHTT